MNDRDSSFIKSYSEQDSIEQSNDLLLLFAEIIADCQHCLTKLRASKVNTS